MKRDRVQGLTGERLWPMGIVTAALLALAVKLSLAYATIGTNDATTWARFADTAQRLGGAGLYRTEQLYNHPPLMVHLLRVMTGLTQSTGLPFFFWLRLPAILADVALLVLVWRLLAHRMNQPGDRAALLLLAAAPPLIMISGFHGNTDPAMIALVVLAVYLIERRAHPIFAGIALGLALSVKVVPAIFVPTFLLYLAVWRARVAFCLGAAVTWGIGSLPYTLQVPELIARQVFAYKGNFGEWGISRLVMLRAQWANPNTPWHDLERGPYAEFGRLIALGAVVAVAVWMNRPGVPKVPLFVQCGLVAFLFLALSPAFGVQYLAWLVPWVVALGWGATLAYHATSGLLLFGVYTSWSGGFPWHYADSPDPGWGDGLIALDLLCWASVVAILVCYVVTAWRFQREPRAAVLSTTALHPSRSPAPPLRRSGARYRR